MRPSGDLRVVGRYTTRFDAEVAVAQLGDAGIQSVLLGDTTTEGEVFGRVRGYEVAVLADTAEDAAVLLEGERPRNAEIDALDGQFYMRRFADRPPWVRWATYALLATVAGPVLLAALVQLGWLAGGLFP